MSLPDLTLTCKDTDVYWLKHAPAIRVLQVSKRRLRALIARLEAAEKVIDTLPELLGGHANLYQSVFSTKSPEGKPLTVPENDIVRKQTIGAIEAWRKAAGK